jgi:hypothetical protein
VTADDGQTPTFNERTAGNDNTRDLFMRMLFLILFLVVAAPDGSAQTTVREFTGNKSTTTPMFTVEAPWILDWRLDADYEQLVALEISLIEARTGRHVGRVLRTQRKGNGVKLFNESGTYQLRIDTTLARYRIKIQQLTEEEAEFYTPRGQ